MAERNELQIGQEWAVCTHGSTYDMNINYRWATKVTIIDADAYVCKVSTLRMIRQEKWVKSPKGQGVRVQATYKNNSGETMVEEKYVYLRNLVAPWSAYEKRQEKLKQEDAEAVIRRDVARKHQVEVHEPAVKEMITRLNALTKHGVSSYSELRYLDTEVVLKLTEALALYQAQAEVVK